MLPFDQYQVWQQALDDIWPMDMGFVKMHYSVPLFEQDWNDTFCEE